MSQFKAKYSEIKPYPLCLGNISNTLTVNNLNKTGQNGYVNDFSVDYFSISDDDIRNIHKYLMNKNNTK